MTADRRSFVLYFDLFEELEMLSIEQRGQWITAIFNYVRDGELPTFEDLGLKMMFSQTRRCLDRDAEKYARICARNSANGAKGGRPKNRTDSEKTGRFSPKAEKADNDKGNETENDTVPENDTVFSDNPPNGGSTKKQARFIPPAVDEVKNYCVGNGYDVDAERFCDYYASTGWQVGKHKMRDWKATVRNWNRRNNGAQINNAPVNNGCDLDELF